MTEEKEDKVQPLRVTPIMLAFVAGLFGALLVDAVKTRYFPPSQDVIYVKLKEYMSEKVNDYGVYVYKDDEDRSFVARMFSKAVEQTLVELQADYDQPIFVGPAVVSGGTDITAELDMRVGLMMQEYIEGREKNVLPK